MSITVENNLCTIGLPDMAASALGMALRLRTPVHALPKLVAILGR
jgi:hypothetical protein